LLVYPKLFVFTKHRLLFTDALSEWGGKNAVNILDDGEWWRLLTPILLHAGIIHLICNIAVQLETGAFFEREWGSTRWMIIYLTSAIGSSILSVIAMPNSVSVGSSGSVMGLFGGKLAEVLCRACESKKTSQGRIAHDVRREQLGGAMCAVTLVMAFSFIPYGTLLIVGCMVCICGILASHAVQLTVDFSSFNFNLFTSRLGRSLGRPGFRSIRRNYCLFVLHQNDDMAHFLVHSWLGNHGCQLYLCPSLHVQWSR
jgi:hypothetical protein